MSRGHPQVGAAEHLHAAGDAGAVDRGDDRLVELGAAQHRLDPVVETVAAELLATSPDLILLLQLGDLGDVRLEVGADAEVLARRRSRWRRRRRRPRRSGPRPSAAGRSAPCPGVARLGAVDGDGDDVVVTGGVVDRHVAPVLSCAVGRRTEPGSPPAGRSVSIGPASMLTLTMPSLVGADVWPRARETSDVSTSAASARSAPTVHCSRGRTLKGS